MTRAQQQQRGRRAEIEADLAEKYHVQFTYLPGVDTDEFDIDRSLNNQARFDQLDEVLAEQYKEAVERGDVFPAVVAYRPGRAAHPKLVTIDGNHRLIGHHRAGAKIDVYEVDRGTKAATIALMTHALNATHGRPTSEAERTSAALYLIDNGASQSAAAAAVNLPMRFLVKALAKANADKRANEVGVDRREWDALAQVGKSRLLNVSTDEGFHDAVHLAYSARLTGEEVYDLVTLLNTTRGANKQRQLVRAEVARYSDRIQDIAGGVLGTTEKRAMTPKARVSMMLGQILSLPEDLSSLTSAYAEGEREEAAGRLIDASERLRKLAKTLSPDLV